MSFDSCKGVSNELISIDNHDCRYWYVNGEHAHGL